MLTELLILVPLALVGVWRWSVWFAKVGLARRYGPYDGEPPDLSVSVVTPVYRADPEDFIEAVESWLANDPAEIIAVIDHGDVECIEHFRSLAAEHGELTCIVTETPGKRPALRDGVKEASSDVIALVDDDVHWREDTLSEFLKPFAEADVGAVNPKQVVRRQETLPQKLYEIQMRLQFAIDYPALSHLSRSLSCVSGRTAVYREEALQPVIDDLVEETFLGKEVISGDDKFLTRAVQRNGWAAVYQSTSVVDIGAAADTRTFLDQIVRWTRNTIRSDLKSFGEGWVLRRKGLAYYTVDRFVATFTILLAPLYFVVTATGGLFLAAGGILLWWFLSRTVKMYPYLFAYRRGGRLVPLYTLGSFVMSPVYLYALFSANTQGWLTRGDDGRYELDSLRRRLVTASSLFLTAASIGAFVGLAMTFRY